MDAASAGECVSEAQRKSKEKQDPDLFANTMRRALNAERKAKSRAYYAATKSASTRSGARIVW